MSDRRVFRGIDRRDSFRRGERRGPVRGEERQGPFNSAGTKDSYGDDQDICPDQGKNILPDDVRST